MDFFGFIPISDEQKEEMKQQQDRAHMHAESFRMEIEGLFNDLDAEKLLTLRKLLAYLANQDNPSMLFFLEGVASATLQHKHNVCGGCGKNHEAELLAEEKEPEPEVTDESGNPAFQQLELDLDNVPTTSEAERNLVQNLKDFNVRVGANGTVICRSCGMRYPNLEDRMMQQDCGGCIHKAKWG